uniref:Uncharacterized protein n=1 Tax=Panagrolaimus davidi TaxID=227884 RepID=A0A914QVR5_9BILA
MDFSIFSQPIEKRTINWKDPQVRQLLDDFINGKLPLRNIPEFANHINKICNTNITLSTIRNRVYQEQRERKLLLKGMQVAASFPSTSSPTTNSLSTSLPGTPKNNFEALAPPDPEPVSVLQAVPVMLRGDDGNEILQGYAIMGDSNQVIMLPEGMQINSELIQPSTNLTIPSQPTVVSPIPKTMVPKRKKSPQIILPKIEEPFVELTDEPLDEWRAELEEFYTQPEPKRYKGPEAPATQKLPNEFLQHFNADKFRVDMDSLKQLSIYVREKVEYLEQATEIFPNHNSFHSTNADAFKRNLDVIKQAGDYFEPLLAFENDPKFFPNALSEIGQAISICAENGTAMVKKTLNRAVKTNE